MKFLLVGLGILFTLTSQAEAQVVAIAPLLPVLVKSDDGKVVSGGLSVDLTREAARRAGLKLDVQIQPWVRALATATATKDVLLFPVAKSAERDALFEWLGPVNRVEYHVFRLASSMVPQARTLGEVAGFRIGVLRNDVADSFFRAMTPPPRLEEVSEYQNLVQMFLAGRFEYLAAAPGSLYDELTRLSISRTDVEDLFMLSGVPIDPFSYAVVAKGSDPKLVASFKAAFDAMAKDGTWERVYRAATSPSLTLAR